MFPRIGLSLAVAARLSSAEPTDIVFALIGDMGYGDLTCFGIQDARRKDIDRLAEQGIRCEQV